MFKDFIESVNDAASLFYELTKKRLKSISEYNIVAGLYFNTTIYDVVSDLEHRLETYTPDAVESEIYDKCKSDKTEMLNTISGYKYRLRDTANRVSRINLDGEKMACFHSYNDNEPEVNELNKRIYMMFTQLGMNLINWNSVEQDVEGYAEEDKKQKNSFSDYLVNCDKQAVMEKLHELLDGAKGKGVALILEACEKKEYLVPHGYTTKTVINEFGLKTSPQSINKYLNKDEFSEDELSVMKKSLP